MQAEEGKELMLTLEYKVDGTPAQYAAIDEGIRVVQFIRNKCLRAWMDRQPEGKNFEAMSVYTAVLEKRVCFCRSVRFPVTPGEC
jgi:putative transposase